LLPAENNDALVLDGVTRGLERVGTMGVTRLLQFAFSNDEVKTEVAVAGFERLRAPVAIRGLNQMLQGDTDGFSDDQIRRIIACYRQIQVDPPPAVLAVVEWLTAHPQAAPDVQIAAMATLAVAGDDPSRARPLAAALLAHPDAAVRLLAIQSIGQWRLTVVAPDLLSALNDPFRQPTERQAMIAALDRLRPADAPPEGVQLAPGAELPLEDLLTLARNRQSRAIQADLLELLARVDAGRIERLVSETGDRQRGRQVFDDARRGRCATCHALAAPADGVGPDLTAIGQEQTLAWLIEAIGHPSRGIAAGHEAWRVEMGDGAAHVGRIEAESPVEVTLRGADGRVTRLATQRIVKRAMLAESLMPDGLEANLSFQEFIDLLALLRSR
jgi:putative heme-binding domain-containing protein